ncbi:MAG: hypothetical protein F4X36_13155 [Gammaproteobacteria bacterium]|nr:hypothetical protein [Gammaproteobacteria bacterium]
MAGGPPGITLGCASPRPSAPHGIGASIKVILAPPCFSASPGIRFLIAGNRQLTAHLHCESPRCGGPRSKGTGSIQGPFERFVGILIEHYAGNLPLWLAPRQVVVAMITSDADGYAREMHAALEAADLRTELDLRNEKIGYKVREHSLAKVPVLLAVGRREAEHRKVAVRRLGNAERPVLTLPECVTALAAKAQPPDTTGTAD